MRGLAVCALLLALLLPGTSALAAEAQEITASCQMIGKELKSGNCLKDGSYESAWLSPGGRNASLRIVAAEGERISAVYMQFYRTGTAFDVQTQDEEGKWQTVSACETDYLTGCAVLETPASAVRIVPRGERMYVAEVHVFAEGEMPQWVQRWEPPLEKADLLLISGHPDDEILFMGGTIPYYAGELKKDVQVAYLVPSMPYRRLELLDGLWLCGVRHYPDLGPFADRYSYNLRELFKMKGWSQESVERYVVGLYRRYRPEVVVTHDVNGEYGHAVHRAAADAAQRCVALAADAGYQEKRLAYTEPWQVKKLYLHLYEENALRMDWRKPLVAFGGRTAFDMAEAAFACHISQQRTDYKVEDFGPYDNAEFGLAFTAVGEDAEKNDFFEHIKAE